MRSGRTSWVAVLILIFACSLASAGTVELAWDSVPGAFGYRVYYGLSSGAYSGSQDVPGGGTTASLGGLADCQTYFIAIKAYNGAGESVQYSNEVTGWARPEFFGLDRIQANQGSQFTLDILGANFDPGASLTFDDSSLPAGLTGNPLVRVESVNVVSCNQIQALVTVESPTRGFRAMQIGDFSVGFEVENPDTVFGSQNSTLAVQYEPARTDINRADTETRDRVDGKDLVWLAYAHGASEGQARYNPDADLDGSGQVDGTDLALMAPAFGLCWNGSGWSASACP